MASNHTKTHFGQIDVFRGEGDQRIVNGTYRDFESAMDVDVPLNASVSQRDVSFVHLLSHISVIGELGKGSFGTAYRIVLHQEI